MKKILKRRGRRAKFDRESISKNSLNKRTSSQTSSSKTQHGPAASFKLTGHLLLSSNGKSRACHSHTSGVARHIQQPVRTT
ncbi:hypothetical protein SADUNF_Sadunf04G0017800 [Salix dunnii]|uniref:Uncharacterized protein n=1 Tax=Salix dunnii TaxID=1413687 RepID=A0A835N047_9ROSI|nr:hypothetical protein SADUNF_Sadunf04G0017800 [Salix dunnii]